MRSVRSSTAPQPSLENAPSSKSSSDIAVQAQVPALKITFLSLFPDFLRTGVDFSILKKAHDRGLIDFQFVQIRDYATGKHRSVDETPYGGGDGMVMKADVMHSAWKAAGGGVGGAWTVFMTPQGPRLTRDRVVGLAAQTKHLILVCGHYEGVDERFIEACVDEEISIGDYVLTGGELPALVVADAVARRIPGVIKEGSVLGDSLEDGLLKYPQYTRPRVFEGLDVPEVLLSGNHEKIAAWRREESQKRTRTKRPDLLK